MIKTTNKLDNFMDWHVLNKNNYNRVLMALGEDVYNVNNFRVVNLNYNNNTMKIDDETFYFNGRVKSCLI